MKIKASLLLLISLLFSLIGNAQVLKWANKVAGPANDIGGSCVADKFGNLYVIGSFESSGVDFDPGPGVFTLNSAGAKDGFFAKYDSTGKFIRAFKIGGSLQDEVNNITLDSLGNFIITGYFRGPSVDFDPSSNTYLLNSNGEAGGDPGYGGDMFVAKYDTAGNFQWAFNVGGTRLGDNGTGIIVDRNNDILVTGYFFTTVDFDPSVGVANLDQSVNGSIFVAKYTANGAYVWAFNAGEGGATDNTGFDIATDNANNVIVTGFFQGSNIDFDPSPSVNALSSAGFFDFFVAKYSPTMQFLWARRAGGTGADVGRAVVVDAADNIFVTGDYNSGSINFNNGVAANTLNNNGSNDLFLVKYSAAGAHIWSFATGGSGGEYGMNICKDGDGNVIIGGAFTGVNTDFDPSPNTISLSSNGGNDIYAVKYSSSGAYLCSFRVGGSNADIARGVASFGNYLYVTGSFNGSTIDFDPLSTTNNLSSASDDVFFAKYDWTIIPPVGSITGSHNCVTKQSQLTFTATSGAGPFTLYINNGASTVAYSNIQSGVSFSPNPLPASTTTYTLTGIKDANLCSAVTPANSVFVMNVPVIPIITSGNAAICKLDSVQLSASGGAAYQWIPATGLSDASIPNPKASPSVNTVYKIVVTDANGCKDSSTLTVSIKPSPVITVSPAAASFCKGDSVQLAASGGSIYQWSPTVGLSNPSISNPKAAPLATTTYKLIVTNGDGCKDSIDKMVTRLPSPSATVSAGGSICPGDSLQLTAVGGVSYQWFPSTGLSNAAISSPKASPLITTVYKAVVTNAEGCKDSATVTVTVKTKPIVTVSTAVPVCKGDSAQLAASGGVSYQWFPVTGLSSATVANPKASPVATTSYTVVVTGANNCVDSAKTIVSVNQPPTITLTSNTSLCFGDSVQLTATGGATYQWLPATGLSNSSIASPKASPATTTTYKLLAYSIANCVDSAFVTVTVKPKPVITISSSASICEGDTTQLNAGGGVTYQWMPATSLSNAAVANPFAFPIANTSYKVIVTTIDGCKDSAQTSVAVSAKPTLDLPKDTALCFDETMVLDAITQNGTSYLWNTGATTPAISVDTPAVYSVVVNLNGCISPALDTIIVKDLPEPTVSLGKDTTICNTYSLELSATGTNIESYLWNTGSTDSFVIAK